MTVISFFYENSLDQFYILLCAQIFYQLFCLYFKLVSKYKRIDTFKNYLLLTFTYMRT